MGHPFPPTIPSAGNFHEAVFSRENNFHHFTKNAALQTIRSEAEMRIQRAAQSGGNEIAPMTKVGGEAGVTWEWRGEKGGGVSGYVSGSASDDNGNKAEVNVEVNSDGSGSATVSVSHDEDSNS